VVNNVETLCAATRVVLKGSEWFRSLGTESSPGTKLLSVSGDCSWPGVYEFEYGTSLREVLKKSGAENTRAVLVGGPSGQFISKAGFDRRIAFDDLATSGAIVIFNHSRDLLAMVEHYMQFFCEESCGYCTPCRFGNEVILQLVQRVRAGWGKREDLELLRSLATVMRAASRCGLGQTSHNPVTSTMENFPELYKSKLGVERGFDLAAATSQATALTGRRSTHLGKEGDRG
ncbi:MAG TPA: NADH-ubiquinone oxidoreductase-F iron-sulfur binding region domain-containing protein, partial [Candidatus Krumholzibacteria bacterium]|nr:NADH-ubiquinone oxidoreductase-F iron-sulfur binding region domain-containing protein [Candidatus Krumholzibacteria bacterium]